MGLSEKHTFSQTDFYTLLKLVEPTDYINLKQDRDLLMSDIYPGSMTQGMVVLTPLEAETVRLGHGSQGAYAKYFRR